MINAFIKCQKLTINQPLIVAETIDYLELKCHFFTSDWDGLTKWMHFRQGETTYDIQLTDDEINKKDHLNLSAGEWDVYVHGNENVNGKVVERITTNIAKLTVEECGNLNGEILPIKPLEVAEQLQAEIDELKKKAVVSGGAKGQALIKKSNADYDMEWGDVAGGDDVIVVTVDKNNTASLSVGEIRKKVLDGAIVELEIQATPTEKVRLSLFQIGERAIFTTTEIMDVQDTSYQVLSISAEIVGTDVYVTNFFKTIDTSKQTVDSALSTTSTNPVQNKIITEEFSRPQYNTLRVNITANPISPDQFKADYSAEEIRKWDVAGGDIEATFTDVITNTGEQRYPFARYVRNEGKAYFFRSVITPDKASRIVITIDNNKNVEFKEDVLNNATKDDIQALEDSKANYTYKVIATDKVSQNDAREVLTYIDQYDGKLIEFLTNGENPSKAVATGRIFTDVSGNAYLVTYNIDGTITVWNKESYEKHNFETKSLINEPIVDLDNLTIDTQGEAPYMASVQKAFNKPSNTSDFGIVTVIAYDVTKQIQIYRDIISGKVEYRTITGTADRHSFSTWQGSGGGTVDTEMSSTSENAVQNKVISQNVAPALIGTEIGTILDIQDASPIPHTMKARAKSKNFLDENNRVLGGAWKILNGKYIGTNSNYQNLKFTKIMLESGKTYTASIVADSANSNYRLNLSSVSGVNESVFTSINKGGVNSVTITPKETKEFNIIVAAYSASSGVISLSKPQIEENVAVTEYTPLIAEDTPVNIVYNGVSHPTTVGGTEIKLDSDTTMNFSTDVVGVAIQVTYNRELNSAFGELANGLMPLIAEIDNTIGVI